MSFHYHNRARSHNRIITHQFFLDGDQLAVLFGQDDFQGKRHWKILAEVHMTQHTFLLHRFCLGIVLYFLLSIWVLPAVYGAAAESFDELHQKATK